MAGDTSVLVQEPAGASATAELDAELVSGAGPQGKPLRRERLEIGGAALAEIARVVNAAPAGSEYALVVRPIPSVAAQPVLDVTLGGVGPSPGAYTVLDRLAQVGLKLDAQTAALKQLVALEAGETAARPKATATLLHRS